MILSRLLAVGWWQRDVARSVEPAQIDGGPGLVIRVGGEVDGVLAAWVENGHVTGAYHVRNPEKPSEVEREVAMSRRAGTPGRGRRSCSPALVGCAPDAP